MAKIQVNTITPATQLADKKTELAEVKTPPVSPSFGIALVEKQKMLVNGIEEFIRLINDRQSQWTVRGLWNGFIKEITHPTYGFDSERIHSETEKFKSVLGDVVNTQQISVLYGYLSLFDTEAKSFNQVMRNFHFNVSCARLTDDYDGRETLIESFKIIMRRYKGEKTNEAVLVEAIKEFRQYVMRPVWVQQIQDSAQSCLNRMKSILKLTPAPDLLSSFCSATTAAVTPAYNESQRGCALPFVWTASATSTVAATTPVVRSPDTLSSAARRGENRMNGRFFDPVGITVVVPAQPKPGCMGGK